MDVKMDDFVMKFVTRYKICDKYMDFATFLTGSSPVIRRILSKLYI